MKKSKVQGICGIKSSQVLSMVVLVVGCVAIWRMLFPVVSENKERVSL